MATVFCGLRSATAGWPGGGEKLPGVDLSYSPKNPLQVHGEMMYDASTHEVPSLSRSIDLSIYLSINQSIYLSIYLSIDRSIVLARMVCSTALGVATA